MVTHAQWRPARFYSTMTYSSCYILWKPRRQLTTRSLKKDRRRESKIPSKPSWYFPQARRFKRVQRESRFSWHSDAVIDATRNRIFECLTYKTSTHVSKEKRRQHTQTQQHNAPSGLEADQRSLCHRSWQSKRGEQEICTRQKKKSGEERRRRAAVKMATEELGGKKRKITWGKRWKRREMTCSAPSTNPAW